MTSKNQLQADMEDAMRSGNHIRRDVLRGLLAAIKQEEIDGRLELDEAGVTKVLSKQAKQRRETIADAERANRADLIAQEERELEIIEAYLPRKLSKVEIAQLIEPIIIEVGASDLKDMGKVMGRAMPLLKGRADGSMISEVVREQLTARS